MSIAATATFTDQLISPGQFSYTVTLNNTGDTSIGTFWFAWDDVPDQDFMSVLPTNIVNPTGWTDSVTSHFYSGLGAGYGIEWQSSSNALSAGASLQFTFDSTETPAEMAGASIFDSIFPVASAFVYITVPFTFNDPGFQLTATPVCFCRGTLILIDRGEVAVEALAVGDRVLTLSGNFKPIVWIGLGRDLVTRANPLARPIVVRRGALADNVPRRDLYLTHGHALYLDGVLIPVENLVNHCSIRWDETARVVEYYHIELAEHDVLFAEGAPAESYYDSGNRALFQTARAGSKAGAATPAFAPVLDSGEIVERVWAALYERAGGPVEPVTADDPHTSDDPDLRLVVDGERLDPASIADGVYTFALAHPPSGALSLCSRNGVPSLLGLNRHEHRRLGVAIRQIILQRPGVMTCFDHDARVFAEGGCYPAESGYSWTDGELGLPASLFAHLMGGFTFIVHTRKQGMRYPIPATFAPQHAALGNVTARIISPVRGLDTCVPAFPGAVRSRPGR